MLDGLASLHKILEVMSQIGVIMYHLRSRKTSVKEATGDITLYRDPYSHKGKGH